MPQTYALLPMLPAKTDDDYERLGANDSSGALQPAKSIADRDSIAEMAQRKYPQQVGLESPHPRKDAQRRRFPLGLEPPSPATGLTHVGEDRRTRVHRRDLLGGLLHEYRRAA